MTYDEARLTPCMVMRTSGSTGLPKVVTIKQGWFCVLDAYRDLENVGASPAQMLRFQELRLFMPFPYFHSAAMNFCLGAVIYYDMTLIGSPAKPLTAELADLHHQHAGCDVSILTSSVIGDIVSDPAALQNLNLLKYLGYGGSRMNASLGDLLSRKTHLFSVLGLTEVD